MRVRARKRKQFGMKQRKATNEKRSAKSNVRKEKRAAKGKAEEIARAKERSPEGKKAAKTLKEKRRIVREKEQAHYQETQARGSARMGGRRKQIQAEVQAKVEE